MNKIIEKYKAEESLLIAILLAIVGGHLDIYTYMARGKVFANTQTGNLVLLGHNIAIGNWRKVIYYLLALCAFAAGICISKIVENKFKVGKYFRWLHLALAIEIITLFLVMLIPEGHFNILANMLVSAVCGLQVQSFHKVNGQSYSNVMFTGNLKNLVDRMVEYFIKKDSEALKSSIIYLELTLSFIAGGWLGTLTTDKYGIPAVGFVNILLGIVFIMLYLEK